MSEGEEEFVEKGIKVLKLCGGEFSVCRDIPMQLNMNQVADELSSQYSVRMSNSEAVSVDLSDEKRITLTKIGNMVIVGVKSTEEAMAVYREVMNLITSYESVSKLWTLLNQ
jgi:TATA-box binding protein (TBP) (component of TFIID and TFIIIB)